ncbi:TM2 domain-containing protein [Corynebacterium doosanense]|uniref:Membrane protein n=1 Tax=Corynebacterium doosanense CAU 212 = DSM 45436 TaxID=558173 RepID=A0A097IHL8_9CORY|nr:TM2 domain-containing protein [Corynebacterium doosanense]AIT61619.1 membrane protein [Corynebacterium doosanense CAU 212 = DSM 45436]
MTNPFDAAQTPDSNLEPTSGSSPYGAQQSYQYQQPQQFQSTPNVPAQYNYAQGTGYNPNQVAGTAPKSKVIAALLAWFLGTIGVHNFYLGNNGRGGLQLGLTVLGWATSWIFGLGLILVAAVGIWAFVEFIMILIGSGKFTTDSRGVPLD